MDKAEIARLTSIFMLKTDAEIRAFIWYKRRGNRSFARDMSAALGLTELPKSDYKVINELAAHLAKLRDGEVEEPEPTFECFGCGGLTEAKGLRWKKLNDGEPLTVSIDHSGKPDALKWLTDTQIMNNWFKPWERNPVVKFKLIESGKGDCHIQWKPIDGPGNTLAFVWQPAGDATYMSEAGDLSGDMTCDSSERVYPKALVHEAGKHEVGHVLGIGHLNAQKDVMYPTARGQKKPLSNNDIREEDERYPFNDSTIAA